MFFATARSVSFVCIKKEKYEMLFYASLTSTSSFWRCFHVKLLIVTEKINLIQLLQYYKNRSDFWKII
jgi:hypothetical protein